MYPHEHACAVGGAAGLSAVPQITHAAHTGLHRAANSQCGGLFWHRGIQKKAPEKSEAVHVTAARVTWNQSLAGQSMPGRLHLSRVPLLEPQDASRTPNMVSGACRSLSYSTQGNLPWARVHMQGHSLWQLAAAQCYLSLGNAHCYSWGCTP